MGRGKFKVVDEAEFDGDVLVTDPCYLRHGGAHEMGRAVGWNPDETEKFVRDRGGLYSTTYYGDWGCTMYRTKERVVGRIPRNAKILGFFCADAGLVCVVALKHVLERSPRFEDWLNEHGHCGTIIRNFKGKVSLMKRSWKVKLRGHVYTETELRVHGEGTVGGEPILFESKQTSM